MGEGGWTVVTLWPEVDKAAETEERARAQAGVGGTTPFWYSVNSGCLGIGGGWGRGWLVYREGFQVDGPSVSMTPTLSFFCAFVES